MGTGKDLWNQYETLLQQARLVGGAVVVRQRRRVRRTQPVGTKDLRPSGTT